MVDKTGIVSAFISVHAVVNQINCPPKRELREKQRKAHLRANREIPLKGFIKRGERKELKD